MKKLLVVVDMQNDFIEGALGTKEAQGIVPKVRKKIEEYHKNGDCVACTMDTHGLDYLSTQEGKNLPVEHCIYQTSGWQLNVQIAEALKDVKDSMAEQFYSFEEYKKHTFGSWNLADALKSDLCYGHNIAEVELCGLCTGICVISNAVLIKSALPEIPITVDAACCACVTPESHENALNAMELLQINIINRKEEQDD